MTRSLEDRLAIFARIADFLECHRGGSPPYAVDLGCGHCKFMQALLDRHWRVVGVDARADRVPARIRDNPLLFRRQRVQETDLAEFDLVLCLGIYYHLTLEDQLALVRGFAGKPVVLDTHYSTRPTASVFAGGAEHRGEIFQEGTGPASSFGNRQSFWPAEEDLVRTVGARHDVLKWLPEHHPGRSFYLLLPR